MKQQKLVAKIALLGLASFFFSCNKKGDSYEKIEQPFELSASIPVDVNPELQDKLKKQGDIYQLNEAFNEFSWKAMVAIFWPRDKEGKPMPNFTDEGKSTWLGWKEAAQVYRKDGGVPAPWESPRVKAGYNLSPTMLEENTVRVFLSSETPTKKIHSKNVADETDQAFAGQLFDQNGNVVYYEVLMNKEEFEIMDKYFRDWYLN